MAQPESSPATSTSTLLSRLTEEIGRQNEGCYWPGPWTLEPHRAEQLIGRADDIGELVYLIRDKSLTVLSGDSGVGKSSLLLAGLVPALRDDGYKTLVCRDWKDNRTDAERARGLEGLSHFLTSKFAADLEHYDIEIPDADDLVAYLDDTFGSEVVLVLDQFEEVIRQQPQLFADLCDWVEAVVDRSQLRVLISLRSEYAHHLTDLRVGAYHREDQAIPAIRDEALIREIILSGRPDAASAQPAGAVIEREAADELVRAWVNAGATKRRSRIRLLHLQALLYSLWVSRPPDGIITTETVRQFLESARARARTHLRKNAVGGGSGPVTERDLAIGLFDWALANVVSVHVERCSATFDALRGPHFTDAPLDEGVRNSLVRLADHLSSGGYKVDQEEIHLAELVLGDELRTLGFLDELDGDTQPEEWARQIIAVMATIAGGDEFDWVAAPTGVLEARVLDEAAERFRTDGITLLNRGVSAGPLLGAGPDRVLVEEARRFFFALHWLHAGNLIRSSPSDDGRNFIALTHDGFGRGLNEWADANDARPETALHALTAAFGRAFDWPSARIAAAAENPLYRSSDGRSRLYANLRWRSCRVVGSKERNVLIRNVVFMNCDLRGTSFQYCTFQGVAFVNCLMDGVQFEDCTIVGRASPLEQATPAQTTDRQLPSFLHADQNDLIATLRHYQDGVADDATWLFSRTSGESVRAVERPDGSIDPGQIGQTVREGSQEYVVTGGAPAQDGGLVMFGGRLSSLAFYRCDFPQTAEVSLRHVAGTSLDFFEHEGGRVELYDVALRGVTVSPPITASLPGAQLVHIEFEAVDSHLENVWFSAGLEGVAEIRNSVVWQLFNGSLGEHGMFQVVLDDDSPFLGIVNVPSEKIKGPAMARVEPEDAARGYEENVRKFVGRIDYRSPRENLEYERRLGEIGEDRLVEIARDEQ